MRILRDDDDFLVLQHTNYFFGAIAIIAGFGTIAIFQGDTTGTSNWCMTPILVFFLFMGIYLLTTRTLTVVDFKRGVIRVDRIWLFRKRLQTINFEDIQAVEVQANPQRSKYGRTSNTYQTVLRTRKGDITLSQTSTSRRAIYQRAADRIRERLQTEAE